MKTITITLKDSGTIEDVVQKDIGIVENLDMDFKIYQGSSKNILLDFLIPKNLITGQIYDENGAAELVTVVKIGLVVTGEDGKKRKTKSYYVRCLKEVSIKNRDFFLFERMMPREFCLTSGDATMIINVDNLRFDNESGAATLLETITSQTCDIPIYSSTGLDVDEECEPSELELIAARLAKMDEDKVSVSQGAENTGKVLTVNEEGKLEPRATIVDSRGTFAMDVENGDLVLYRNSADADGAEFSIGDDGYMRIDIKN